LLADRSDDVGSIVEFSTIPSDPEYPEQYWGERIYTIAAVYAGEGERLLQPLRELGDQVADFSGQMSYCDIQQLADALMPFGQYRAYWKRKYPSARRARSSCVDPMARTSPGSATSNGNTIRSTSSASIRTSSPADRSAPASTDSYA
jgi:hypothetical protein